MKHESPQDLARQTTTENNFTFVAPNTKITPTAVGINPALDPVVNLFGRGGTSDQSNDALVPASFAAIRTSDRVVLGFSFNSPFGLGVKPDENWAGQLYSYSSKLKTYQGTASVAVDVTDTVTIGAGVQVLYAEASLKQGTFTAAGLPRAAGFPISEFEGSGTGFGATLGILWKPMPGTEIGLGWRSAITTRLDGGWNFPGTTVPAPPAVIPPYRAGGSGDLTTPDFITFGFSHRFSPNWKVLGTVEWANWSRVRDILIEYDAGAPPPGAPPTLPFYYEDSWFFSVGLEWQATEALALRTGIGYNTSPVPDSSRNVRVPDNDRIWASVGASYRWSDRLSMNAGYTFIHVEDAPIAVGPGNPTYRLQQGTFFGEAESHVHILSAGLTVRWGTEPAPVVRKY